MGIFGSKEDFEESQEWVGPLSAENTYKKSNMLNVSQGIWARLTGLLCFDYSHKELGIRGI